MSNVLSDTKREQVLALGQLGWSLREIERKTGVRRETISGYLAAAEDLLELVMRRYERASTLFTSNRPAEDWGKLLGDNATVAAMLDRLLHHAHVLQFGPRSWRTKTADLKRSELPA